MLLTTIATLGCCTLRVRVAAAQENSGAADGLPPASQPTGDDPRLISASQPAAEEPDQPPASPAPRFGSLFHFEEMTLELGFEADWQHRNTYTDTPGFPFFSNRDRQSNRMTRFQETMGLDGAGDIVNERTLRYQFNVLGGFSQESFSETRPGPDLHERPHGDLLEYDAQATLFPAGRVSANFFALKQDDRVPRMFLPSLERQRERYAADLIYSDRFLPMRLSLESAYEELLSFDRELDDKERHNDKRLEYEATWQPTEHHQLRLDYEYDDRREEYSGSRSEFDTTRNYLTLNHALQFGDDHKSRLDTVARFQDETGDLARDVYEFAPQLRLQHSDTLSTSYRFQYLQESYEGDTLELFRGDVGANKRISDWLDLGLNFYGLSENVDHAGDTAEWGGTATGSVAHENSLGNLGSNLTYNHAQERTESDGHDGVVIGESITLRDPLPTYLAHEYVRRISILVTDAGRTRTFLPGRDYNVVQVGRYTWLRRVPTGRITDGQTVLVNYLYRTNDGFELNRDRLDFRVQQAFKNGWTPYYATSLQEEDIDRTRFLSYQARDINRHRIGVDYRQPRWSAGTEFEYNDDAIDPYKGLHLRADATLYEKAPHTISGRGNFSFLRFDGSGDLDPHEASLLDLGTSYQFLLDPNWDVGVTAAYRYEDDSLYGITHGVDFNTGVHWKIGQFTASVEVEYDLLNLPGSTDGTFAVWLRLRRGIPLIGARR